MAQNTTASLDKLVGTYSVEPGKTRNRFGRFFGFQKHFKNLDLRLNFSRNMRTVISDIRITKTGEKDINYFITLRNQPFAAAEKFRKEETCF